MSLTPPPKVGKLQEALHAKAKRAPDYRFYALYDKVYRRDVLGFAFDRCRSNDGAPGIDGQTFADIEAYGVETWLDELADDLRQVADVFAVAVPIALSGVELEIEGQRCRLLRRCLPALRMCGRATLVDVVLASDP